MTEENRNFNLERSIKNWLKGFKKHEAYNEGALEEMELHVRDHIEDLMNQGFTEQNAFEQAIGEFGDVPKIAREEYWNLQRTPTLGSIVNGPIHRNFYAVAVRNLIKHRAYFGINILGLSLGIASFIFISLYVMNELSYDRFHANYENIYTITSPATIRGEENHNARSSNPLANTLLAEYPEIKETTRIASPGSALVARENNMINEDKLLFADERFLKVFDFKLITGNRDDVLSNPQSILLTSSYAKKYFGTENPIGRELLIGEAQEPYKITGLLEDCPPNSHIQFDLIGSIASKDEWNTSQWIGGKLYTYAVVDSKTNIEELENKLGSLFYKYMAPEIEYYTGMSIQDWEDAGNKVGYKLTAIEDIHLNSTFTAGELTPGGNMSYVYIYALIGVVILLVAIFNFVNLATAYSSTRSKEVGVRKVIGSSKNQLIYQFVMESVLVAFVSTAIAAIIVIIMTPHFVELIGKGLAFRITDQYSSAILLSVLALLVGLLSGLYPSTVLASFKPVEVLKGRMKSGVKSGWLRSSLVTLQFSVATVIIIGTVVIYDQLNFMLNKSLGFEKEQILVVERPDWLGENIDVFKEELQQKNEVLSVTNSLTLPGKRFEIRSYRKKDEREVFLLLNNQVNYEYLDVMGVKLIAGRFFSKQFKGDSNAVVINETAAKAFGFDDPIGKPLTSAFKKGRPLKIIGVVKDYHIESLHKSIEPTSLELDTQSKGFVSIKISSSQNVKATVASIEDLWDKMTYSKPFEYFFLKEDYAKLYDSESTTGRVLVIFASLSIFIACLGLIGLITLTTAVRAKEIGIRKVLGAGSGRMIFLLSKETTRLLGLSTMISWPVSYFACEYWLQNFMSRTHFNPWIYVISTLTVLVTVALCVSIQSIKVATSNPVKVLRTE